MNKRIAIGLAIMAMAATAVQAVTYVSATGVSANWTGTGAWGSSGGTPGSSVQGDLVKIVGGSTITLNSDIPASFALGNVQAGEKTVAGGGNLIIDSGAYLRMLSTSTLTAGQDALGTITMNGGTVTGKTVTVSQGVTTSAGSSFTMHGGLIDIEGPLFVGKFANGSLTMDGGTIKANVIRIGDLAGTTVSSATLTGGSIEIIGSGTNGLNITSASGVLNMGGNGQLIMAGNQWSVIEAYVNSGDITWASGSGVAGFGDKTWGNGSGSYLHTAYDAGTTKTTVWVNQTIPEPATVGMLGLGSLIVLLVRRMRG